MRSTSFFSLLRLGWCGANPAGLERPSGLRISTQIKAGSGSVRWATVPAPPASLNFIPERHPRASSAGTVLTAQKRLRKPGRELTSESQSSAKCTEHAKPRRVRVQTSAYVQPGTSRGLREGAVPSCPPSLLPVQIQSNPHRRRPWCKPPALCSSLLRNSNAQAPT